MIVEFFTELGAWGWILAGLLFLAIEILAPGFLFLWLGIGALAVGGIGLLGFVGAGWSSVAVLFVAFAEISIVSALAGRSIYAPRKSPSDAPLLNQRGAQFVGREVVLSEPISGGRGRVKIGDTVWRVTGPDRDAGSTMVVVSADGAALVLGDPAA